MTFLTFVVKSLVKTCLFLYDRVTASASNLYQSFLYVSKYLLIRKNQLQENQKWRAFTNCVLLSFKLRQVKFSSAFTVLLRIDKRLAAESHLFSSQKFGGGARPWVSALQNGPFNHFHFQLKLKLMSWG